MSKRSRNKKDKPQNSKKTRKPSEQTQTEKSQAEEPQPEESQADEPRTEVLQTEGPQTEEPQTEKPQAEEPQEEELWSKEFWLEEPWLEELWPEETPASDIPAVGPPAAEIPGVEIPAAEIPAAEPPAAEAPAVELPAVEPHTEQAWWKNRKRIISIALIALAVVIVLITTLTLLHNRWFQKPIVNVDPLPGVSGNEPPDPSETVGADAVKPLAFGQRKSEDYFTILIFGTDEVSGLTDTIMVASYNVTDQKAAVLSIPRDTLINNPYLYSADKSINAAYKQNGSGERGASALKTEVSRLVGFVPDFYVTIDWELVGKMVDAIGGVYFEIPWRMGYDDPTQDLHIHFEEGYQYLDGKAAMDLVRWRKNNNTGFTTPGGGSDLSRLNVQHDFLKAVLKQALMPQNIIHIPELVMLFNENVDSDLTLENMLWFGQEAVLGGLSAEDVEFATMPVYGTANDDARYYGKVCAIPDQLLAVVNRFLNPYVEDVTLRQLDLIQMSADGNILSSTTGILRNPAAGVYTYPTTPEASEPPEGTPGSVGPPESTPGSVEPPESTPGFVEPPENTPGIADPVESAPAASDPTQGDPGPDLPDDPPPESGPPEMVGDGPDNASRGDAPDLRDT